MQMKVQLISFVVGFFFVSCCPSELLTVRVIERDLFLLVVAFFQYGFLGIANEFKDLHIRNGAIYCKICQWIFSFLLFNGSRN